MDNVKALHVKPQYKTNPTQNNDRHTNLKLHSEFCPALLRFKIGCSLFPLMLFLIGTDNKSHIIKGNVDILSW